jgi:hypothetical protein
MKKKNIYILVIVLFMLLIASMLILSNQSTTMRNKDKDFAVQDTSSITKFFLADKDGRQVLVQRMGGGNWVVNDTYIANKPVVDQMLKTMANVAVLQPVARAAHNNVVKRMAATAVKVEIYQTIFRINLFGRIKLFPKEKLTKVYYVGDNTQDNVGTYMLMDGSQTPFVTYLPGFMGFISLRYTTKIGDWRDHTIFNFRLGQIKSVKMETPKTPDSSFVFNNLGSGNIELIRLTDGAIIDNYDEAKALDFLSAFNDIKFEAIMNEMDSNKRDSIINAVPDFKLTVTTSEDREFTISAFRRRAPEGSLDLNENPMIWDLDRLFVYLHYSNDLTVCQYFVLDRILRPLYFFTPSEQNTIAN